MKGDGQGAGRHAPRRGRQGPGRNAPRGDGQDADRGPAGRTGRTLCPPRNPPKSGTRNAGPTNRALNADPEPGPTPRSRKPGPNPAPPESRTPVGRRPTPPPHRPPPAQLVPTPQAPAPPPLLLPSRGRSGRADRTAGNRDSLRSIFAASAASASIPSASQNCSRYASTSATSSSTRPAFRGSDITFADSSGVNHWKISTSSAASTLNAAARFLGVWYCCQSRAAANSARRRCSA